jgi:hypothetical protein
MKNKKDHVKKEQQTPIIDGDTRPDKNVEQPPVQKPDSKLKDGSKFTAERQRDVNSLEDYKDGK